MRGLSPIQLLGRVQQLTQDMPVLGAEDMREAWMMKARPKERHC